MEGAGPVIAGGREPAYHIDRPNRQGGETIVIAGSGAPTPVRVILRNEPYFRFRCILSCLDRGLQPLSITGCGADGTIHVH